VAARQPIPPSLLLRFFRWYCHPKLADRIEGDLREVFHERAAANGERFARLRMALDILLLFRPGIIRPLGGVQSLNNYGMVGAYFKIGFRNLMKNKLFSAINISGMAISMGSFLLIGLFVFDELRFDTHIADADRKFRVYNEMIDDDGSTRLGSMVPPMVVPTMKEEFPEVESTLRFLNFNNPILFTVGETRLTEANGGYAENSVFGMFSMELVEGDPATALTEPETISINATLKKKYFGDKPALGETITLWNRPMKIVAVYEDFPAHAHFQRNFMIALPGFIRERAERMQSWGWTQFHSYIKLKPDADVPKLQAQLEEFSKKHAWSRDFQYYFRLMPLKDVHLYASGQLWDLAVHGNIQTIYILLATAAFILVVAILNFVNLSTARAVNRGREVGVRKVAGAFRSQLVQQFISEAILIALIALTLGIVMAGMVLPVLNQFTEKQILLGVLLDPRIIVALLAFAALIGIAAGTYPAFHISAMRPAMILSSKSTTVSGKNLLRKGLVVFQFILSFFLIIASLVVANQHRFMRSADMGFDKDNIVVLRLRGQVVPEAARDAFANHPNIINASLGYGLPGEAHAGDGINDSENGDKEMGCSMLTVDHDYIRTLGLEVIAGRDFSRDFPSDEKNAFILSEEAAKLLGHTDPNTALGHKVSWPRWDNPDSLKKGTVVGVVRDIQLNSMRDALRPVVLHIFPYAYNTLALRIRPDDVTGTIGHLEKTWKSLNSQWPFEYKFLDENFDKMYKSEEKLASLFASFTTFTIFVACLGLFGLVVYSTSQRFKEIGIRKVLGASEGGLVLQLGKGYLLLLAISFLIAIPASYFAASAWLERFPFRVDLSALLFVKAAVLIIGIALITVGVQSFLAAKSNPVAALKEQ